MGVKIVRKGHWCDLPSELWTTPNTIVECDQCGQRYILNVDRSTMRGTWQKHGTPFRPDRTQEER